MSASRACHLDPSRLTCALSKHSSSCSVLSRQAWSSPSPDRHPAESAWTIIQQQQLRDQRVKVKTGVLRERERERERAHLLWLTAGETLSSQYRNCHTPGVSTDSNFHTLTHSAFFLSQFLSHTGLTLLFVFLCPRCSLSLSKLSQLSFVRWLLSLGLSVPCLLHPPAATTTSWNVVTFEGSLCDRTHSHTYKGGTILLPCTDSVDLDYFSSFILFHYTSISFISF